ncbi:hypothetical protein KY285_025895 [Solanum tuberosum]|nr:hypothetical protein KY285_025895 [Solanum tuberosum]
MTVLDRFSGGNDPEGWILQAEQKIAYAISTANTSVSLVDTSRFYIDYLHNAKFVPPATSTSPVVTLSHITNSSDLENVVTNGNMEADHMLEILLEKYTNVN